jgi:HD superfamily phosphodiesterase
MDFGCAAYCQFAEQCIGDLPPELLVQKQDLLKDRVAVEMKRIFKNDFDRIGHATRVARYAERIGKAEGGNLVVILCAAYLQNIDAYEARRKHGRHTAQQLKSGGPSTAKSILAKLGADEKIVAEVIAIIAEDSSRSHQSVNDQVVHDANKLEKLEQNQKQETRDAEMLSERIEASFLTDSGRELAREMLLKP